jgi:diguanylate cyclase (GGDEF)-like protein
VTAEEFVIRISQYKEELFTEVIPLYQEGNKERGRMAFRRWRERFEEFLKETTPDEAAQFMIKMTHFAWVAKPNEHPFDQFMREDGETCIAFLDDLQDATLKGRIEFKAMKQTSPDHKTLQRRMVEIRDMALAYFDRYETDLDASEHPSMFPFPTQDVWASVSSDDRKVVAQLSEDIDRNVAGIARAAKAVAPLVSELDQKELRKHMRSMTAALRFRQYEEWDSDVLHDEGTVLGVTQPGHSENRQIAAKDARQEFETNYDAVVRVLKLITADVDAGNDTTSDLDEFGILYRKSLFDEDIEQMVLASKRNGEPLAVIEIDADFFKQVNDNHGHQVGDETLRELFTLVRRRVKGKGRAYRFGGDEVAVLLPNYSTEEAVALAERIRKDYQGSDSGQKYGVTGSIGVACMPEHASTATDLFSCADRALYLAKASGRNAVTVFKSEQMSGLALEN